MPAPQFEFPFLLSEFPEPPLRSPLQVVWASGVILLLEEVVQPKALFPNILVLSRKDEGIVGFVDVVIDYFVLG